MALKRRPARTLAEVAMANAGIRSGSHAITFMVNWGLASAELGHEPSLEEYCEIHGVDRATFYRHQSAYRKAFPGEESPTRLNAATGADKRYQDLVATLRKGLKGAGIQVQAMAYTVGAAQFPGAGPSPA